MNERESEYIKEIFSVYSEVEWNPDREFNILHLYSSGEEAYPDGYVDAKFFTIRCYNTKTKEMFVVDRNMDSLMLASSRISNIRIFVDGSTCITFVGMHQLPAVFQAPDIERV